MSSTVGNTIGDATIEDVETLATIIPRTYPSDDFMAIIFKDGPPMRQWWTDVYTRAINDPTYRILVARNESVVVGLLTLALWRKSSKLPEATPGLCTLVPLTDDHHGMLKEALVEQTDYRRKVIGEQTNFMVDLLCVDRALQSHRIGRRLVRRACEIADEEKAAIFLVTGSARDYYLKLGFEFEEKGEATEPDAESIIVRQPL